MSFKSNIQSFSTLSGDTQTINALGPTGSSWGDSTEFIFTSGGTVYKLKAMEIIAAAGDTIAAGTDFLKKDGTTPLTADWDAGNFRIICGKLGIGISAVYDLDISKSADSDYVVKIRNSHATGWGEIIQAGADVTDPILTLQTKLNATKHSFLANGSTEMAGNLTTSGNINLGSHDGGGVTLSKIISLNNAPPAFSGDGPNLTISGSSATGGSGSATGGKLILKAGEALGSGVDGIIELIGKNVDIKVGSNATPGNLNIGAGTTYTNSKINISGNIQLSSHNGSGTTVSRVISMQDTPPAFSGDGADLTISGSSATGSLGSAIGGKLILRAGEGLGSGANGDIDLYGRNLNFYPELTTGKMQINSSVVITGNCTVSGNANVATLKSAEGVFVDRGDIGSYDFTDATHPISGYISGVMDLDLSSIVGANAKTVLLQVYLADDTANFVQFRKKGNANASATMYNPVGSVAIEQQLIISMNTSKIIEFNSNVAGASWTDILITVRGWWN